MTADVSPLRWVNTLGCVEETLVIPRGREYISVKARRNDQSESQVGPHETERTRFAVCGGRNSASVQIRGAGEGMSSFSPIIMVSLVKHVCWNAIN